MNRKNLESFDVARSAPRKQTKQAPRAERKGNSDAPSKKSFKRSEQDSPKVEPPVKPEASASPPGVVADTERSTTEENPGGESSTPKKKRARASRRPRNG